MGPDAVKSFRILRASLRSPGELRSTRYDFGDSVAYEELYMSSGE